MIQINVLSLPVGISEQKFQWVIRKDEYDFFDEDIYINGFFHINNIHSRQIEFNGRIDFEIQLVCDRCLKKFKKKFEENIIFILKKDYIGDDIDIISFNDFYCDITDFIKDLVITSLPVKVLCDENCKGICPGCGVNLNEEKCKCNL